MKRLRIKLLTRRRPSAFRIPAFAHAAPADASSATLTTGSAAADASWGRWSVGRPKRYAAVLQVLGAMLHCLKTVALLKDSLS